MIEARKEYFTNLSKEEKLKLNFTDFTNTEIKEILEEIQLKEECKKIAIMHHIECLTIEEIAYRLQLDRKTVIRRLKLILMHLRWTCIKLFFKNE